jgi:hypothetical protein
VVFISNGREFPREARAKTPKDKEDSKSPQKLTNGPK